MEDFRSYLASHRIVPEKKLAYYLSWVTQFYTFCDKNPSDEVSTSEIENILKHLTKTREDWQVNQAGEAIQLYFFLTGENIKGKRKQISMPTPNGEPWHKIWSRYSALNIGL